MRAVVQDSYGPPGQVLRVAEIPAPAVGAHDVLVRVHAASLHADVWHVVTGQPMVMRIMGAGLLRPSGAVPGTDLSGSVEAVGRRVTRFRPGDDVFGETILGMQWVNGGSFAEYAVAPERSLALKPARVSHAAAAAAATAGLIVLSNLRGPFRVLPGQRVLVNGAAGAVGSIVVQVARARGAWVAGVDAGRKLDVVRQLGADRAIDYEREDVAALGERYDLIVDVASTLTLAAARRLLTPVGLFLLIGHDHYGAAGRRIMGSIPRFFMLMARSPFDRHLRRPQFADLDKPAALEELRSLLESGQLTPPIDRVVGLDEIHGAMERLVSGANAGRIIIAPQQVS